MPIPFAAITPLLRSHFVDRATMWSALGSEAVKALILDRARRLAPPGQVDACEFAVRVLADFALTFDRRQGLALDGPPPASAEVLEALLAGPRDELVRWMREHVANAAPHVATIHLMMAFTALMRASQRDEGGLDPDFAALADDLGVILSTRSGIEPQVLSAIADACRPSVAAQQSWVRRFPY